MAFCNSELNSLAVSVKILASFFNWSYFGVSFIILALESPIKGKINRDVYIFVIIIV